MVLEAVALKYDKEQAEAMEKSKREQWKQGTADLRERVKAGVA